MRKKQGGQALILVLILLAIGTLLIVPLLQLNITAIRGIPVVTRQLKAVYAASGAQEWVMWNMIYTNLASQFSVSGDTKTFTVNVCDTTADVTLIMRAVPGLVSRLYDTKYTIQPVKTVSYSTPNDGSLRDYTYTIKLKNVTDTSQTLDSVYDILPLDTTTNYLSYKANTSEISIDGGTTWQAIGEPRTEIFSSQRRLLWPSTYNYTNKTGGFSSPIKDFARGQEKLIRFTARGTLANHKTYYNWVVLMPNSVISLPQAPIVTGTGVTPVGGFLVVQKTADPPIIRPGVITNVQYDISVTNLESAPNIISSLTDYLPPEFSYLGTPPPSGITTLAPTITLGTYNGVQRYKLVWSPNKSIASGQTLHLVFWAKTTQNVSGEYYNEATIQLSAWSDKSIFQSIGVDQNNNSVYSWNSGVVMVPAFDSRTVSDPITIDSNMGLILGGVSIRSWMLR